MKRIRSSHLIVGAVALLMLLAAGTATASNMAFKINMTVYRPTSVGGTSNCVLCDNWISLPFNSSFIGKNLAAFCDTNGDGTLTTADTVALVSQQGTLTNTAALDSVVTHNCAIPSSANPLYQATRGVRLRAKSSGIPTGNAQIIYVGSDVPGTQILFRQKTTTGGTCPGALCDNWVDLVYHTTYTNLRSACDSDGSGTIDSADKVALVSQQGTLTVPGSIDSVTTHNCAIPSSSNPAVQIGRAMRIRLKTTVTGDALVSEPHF